MRKLIALICCLALFPVRDLYAAAVALTSWEFRAATGASTNGGGFGWTSIRNASYKWTASGSGTNEYYCEAAAGGDPGLTFTDTAPKTSVMLDGNFNLATEGTAGSLTAGQYDWADNDTLGYSTIYVRLADGADPDTKNRDRVCIGYGGGHDYSQQAAAQLTLTDGANSGIGITTFTSATGGFTAAMVGNCLRIASGTNTYEGFYQITAYTDTNTVTLDRAPDDTIGAASNAVFSVGGALDILFDGTPSFFDALTSALDAGNIVWIKNDGTMTLLGALGVAKSGTLLAPISFEGYNATRGDQPTDTDRPLIAAGANNGIIIDNFGTVRHLRWTTTAATGLSGDLNFNIINCKSENTSVTADRNAFDIATAGTVSRCEGVSTNGPALLAGINIKAVASYFHDSARFVQSSAIDSVTIIGCVFDTITTAIQATSVADYWIIYNSLFYNCGTAILAGATNDSWNIMNTIFHSNTTGVSWGDEDRSMYVNYNIWYNNTTDLVNLAYGENDIFADPLLTDPVNGDFTLQSGSPALAAGIPINNAGVTGTYKWNIGVDQDDVAAGGGQTSHTFIGQ